MDCGTSVQPEPADVPQSAALDERQVVNNAGGFVYKIDDFARLRRFIILGSNGNNYYVSNKQLELENCECVLRLLAEGHGLRVVSEVNRISLDGRAPRQASGILVLAVCARFGDLATRRAALAALPAVCRTASTLFELVQRCKELGPAARATRPGDDAADPRVVMSWLQEQKSAAVAATGDTPAFGDPKRTRAPRTSGIRSAGTNGKASWGRSMRRAIALWYLGKNPAAVAYQATKYSQRNGWSHADLLRLAHPDPEQHAAKRRKKLLTATTAAPESANGSGNTRAAIPAAEASVDDDVDWVMLPHQADNVPEAMAEMGAEDVDKLTSELGTLTAVTSEPLGATTGGEGGDAALDAQRVVDMKAIFDFLTHGTLPGQERAPRRAKGQKALGGSGATEGQTQAAAESSTSGAAVESAAAGDDVNANAAVALTADVAMAEVRDVAPQEGAADAVESTSVASADAGTSAAALTTAAKASTSASGGALSPVMQYLIDAHRLRKEIRAPPPLIKEVRAPRSPGINRFKRHRGKGEIETEAKPVEHVPPSQADIDANNAARNAAVAEAIALVRRHRFGHEHVGDTGLLKVPEVWASFLEVGMPLTALVRNLGRMTEMGLMKRPDCVDSICRRLSDGSALERARVHPMTLLEALCTYRHGQGARGVARWDSEPRVLEALEAGFYLAFKNVRPTGQRYLAGLDVSGSMASPCGGMTSVSCKHATAALLMCLVRSEPWIKTMAFSNVLVPMELKPEDRLEEVIDRADAIPMGGTDCSLPILYALEKRIPVDVILILTDNETWCGGVHPKEALRRYRAEMNLPGTKLVVMALSSTVFSIADPDDPGMLDVAGLDSSVPQLVANFVSGKF